MSRGAQTRGVAWYLAAGCGLLIAVVFLYTGVTKLGAMLGDGAALRGSWAASFGAVPIWTLTIAEIAIALLLFAMRWRIGLALAVTAGIGMFFAFVFKPPAVGQTCGCSGGGVLDTSQPLFVLVHIIVLTAVSSLGLLASALDAQRGVASGGD